MEVNLNKNKCDVLFTANRGYIDILLSSISSLLLNSCLNNVRVHIICENFTKDDYKRVEDLIKSFASTEVYFYPIEDYDISKYNIPDWHGTQISNARLFFGDILKPYLMNLENLLYLDADSLTVGDLSEITNYNPHLCACKDACLRNYYESFPTLDTYYNSGIIYINVSEWMSKDYQSKIINFLRNNKRKLNYPDQDIFNCALKEEIRELPINYNVPPHAYMFNDLLSKVYFNGKYRNVSYEEIKQAILSPKIIHSYGLSGIKPWQTDFNPFYEVYMKYIKEINPNFTPSELDNLKRMIVTFPYLYKFMMLVRTYMNHSAEKAIQPMALKFHQSGYKKR